MVNSKSKTVKYVSTRILSYEIVEDENLIPRLIDQVDANNLNKLYQTIGRLKIVRTDDYRENSTML